MISVMLAIRPEWCSRILCGRKTLEIRKTRPLHAGKQFRVYLYCTDPDTNDPHKLLEIHNHDEGKIYRGNGNVVGEFICDGVEAYGAAEAAARWGDILSRSCLKGEDLEKYKGDGMIYGWRITEAVTYDRPVPISDFLVENNATYDAPLLVSMKRPPQSWCYVEGRLNE